MNECTKQPIVILNLAPALSVAEGKRGEEFPHTSRMYNHNLLFVLIVIVSGLLFFFSCKKLDLKKQTALTTDEVSVSGNNTVIATGTIIDLGEGNITDHGHCWSASAEPTVSDNKFSLGVPSATGSFSSTITGLSSGTWYIRAFAVDGANVLYGDVINFSITGWVCGSTLTDNRDGRTYSTVLIGSQCWMAQNLNVGSVINSNSTSDDQTDNSIIEKYCYSNDSSTCTDDGGLYQWDEAMQYNASGQGICPEGWHIPTDNEWKSMEVYLGMAQASVDSFNYRGTDEGKQIKLLGSTGFEASGTGYRKLDGNFYGSPQYAYFWTTTDNGTQAWTRGVKDVETRIYRNTINKSYGLCIRCLKN